MMDFDWAYLFEISLTGIAGGGLYALAALAFVLVYKATRVVNIAIGEMLMAGAICSSPSRLCGPCRCGWPFLLRCWPRGCWGR